MSLAFPSNAPLGILQEWWQSPGEVDLVQFMGKDNVPFHTIIFPATLLGTQVRLAGGLALLRWCWWR